MPLLTSPIDGAPMRQIHRYGVEFDVCPTTGGVWLDKGELEKLIALVKEETMEEADRQGGRDGGRGRFRGDDHDDDEDHRISRRGGRRSRLADLFDF